MWDYKDGLARIWAGAGEAWYVFCLGNGTAACMWAPDMECKRVLGKVFFSLAAVSVSDTF